MEWLVDDSGLDQRVLVDMSLKQPTLALEVINDLSDVATLHKALHALQRDNEDLDELKTIHSSALQLGYLNRNVYIGYTEFFPSLKTRLPITGVSTKNTTDNFTFVITQIEQNIKECEKILLDKLTVLLNSTTVFEQYTNNYLNLYYQPLLRRLDNLTDYSSSCLNTAINARSVVIYVDSQPTDILNVTMSTVPIKDILKLLQIAKLSKHECEEFIRSWTSIQTLVKNKHIAFILSKTSVASSDTGLLVDMTWLDVIKLASSGEIPTAIKQAMTLPEVNTTEPSLSDIVNLELTIDKIHLSLAIQPYLDTMLTDLHVLTSYPNIIV